VKLTDFGISKELTSALKTADTFVGTSLYMAPERAHGAPYSFASDVWSHGIVSLELLTGQHPFPARASFLELYDALFRQPEPRLEDTFTEDAQTFVAVQLRRDANARLDARMLMDHPFLQHTSKEDFVTFLHGLEQD
jgi:serine/threonine protein kinase